MTKTPNAQPPPPNAFEEGLSRFNSHRFWDAHESWETIWLSAAGDDKQFLQGLIQLAAAYHHVQRGTYRGGVRLFDAALRRLAAFPDGYRGVDREEAVARAVVHREAIARGEEIHPDAFPKLRYN